uniref:Ferritin n=1 Tax=Cyprinus carpio carpio TaxID=630221 RepID=A0A8C1I4T1_CYPCA
METSQVRQNYDRDCEALINKMINLELYAGYTYTSMTHYLEEQVEAIKKLGDHITNLTKMDAGNNRMAEYLFDKHTLDGSS